MTLPAHHPNLDEPCTMCAALEGERRPARHKVAEVLDGDWPEIARQSLGGDSGDGIDVTVTVARHELTTFLCCAHFAVVMGPLAALMCEQTIPGLEQGA